MSLQTTVSWVALLGLASVAADGCATSSHGGFDSQAPDGAAPPTVDAMEAGSLVGEGGADGQQIGSLTGTVTAPEGSIPISNALVYLSETAPPPIPSGAYCDKCVAVTSASFGYTAADGTFSIPVLARAKRYLVLQKGQFRRVRQLELIEGMQAAPAELTTLPAKNDEVAGDHIPQMAIVRSDNDHIESSLAKLGLGQVDDNGAYVEGSGSFDLYDVTKPGATTDYAHLLAEPQTIAKYNVVFFPCGGNSGTTCNATDTTSGRRSDAEDAARLRCRRRKALRHGLLL